jgi:hypothetical protein
MKRPHFHPAQCKVCGISAQEAGGISQQGYCLAHSLERFAQNIEQLQARNGPYFEHWARRVLLSAHRALVASRAVDE